MIPNTQAGFQREIQIKCQMIEAVWSFKNLTSIIAIKESKPEILSRNTESDNSSSFSTENRKEGQKHFACFHGKADPEANLIHILLCLCELEFENRTRK